jgi:hypothetical protein
MKKADHNAPKIKVVGRAEIRSLESQSGRQMIFSIKMVGRVEIRRWGEIIYSIKRPQLRPNTATFPDMVRTVCCTARFVILSIWGICPEEFQTSTTQTQHGHLSRLGPHGLLHSEVYNPLDFGNLSRRIPDFDNSVPTRSPFPMWSARSAAQRGS